MAKKAASKKAATAAAPTAKKAPKLLWKKDRENALDSAFAAAVHTAQTKFGRDDICVGSEADALVVGLPLPSLAVRMIYQNTVHPLGRVTQIVGPQGSCKSALLYEAYRWHAVYGGGHAHNEVENKDSPLLRRSIHNYNDEWLRRSIYNPCDSLEQWQNGVTHYTNHFCDLMDEPGGPGRTFPVAVGVDSLSAAAPEAEQEQVNEDGHAIRGYALLANLITRYMRCRSTKTRRYPISVMGVNHQKIAQSAMPGVQSKTTPGGVQIDFQATHIIEMTRVNVGYDINFADRTGLRVDLKMNKNSQGASREKIVAEFIWWWDKDPETGDARQRHRWDWETAAIEALLDIEKYRKSDFKRIMDIVDLHAKRTYPRTVWSKTLGIPESSPLSWFEAGQILESRQDVLDALYPELGIGIGYEFKPGVDYAEMLEQAKNDGAKASAVLYTSAMSGADSQQKAAAAGVSSGGKKRRSAAAAAQRGATLPQ